jgi:hypothetical protein
MNGYLTFLKKLSPYQQRFELGHLAFTERWNSSLEKDLLKMPAAVAFSQSLGIDASLWKSELRHYAEDPDVIEMPVFGAGWCRALFTLRYVESIRSLDHSHEDLLVRGIIGVDDNQRAVIGMLAASSTREESGARGRLVALGVDPETLDTVPFDAKPTRKIPYLGYLQTLLPQQRSEAIYDLAELAWGGGGPKPIGFFGHPKLAPELARLEIRDLGIGDRCHQVGPVEFTGGRCTALIRYPLYNAGDGLDSLGYYVEVHILAGITNKPGGGGDIQISDLWFRIEDIDEPSEDSIPLLVP